MNNNPSYPSPEYVKHAEQVELVSSVFNGIDDSVKYISKFPREDSTAYIDRQSKATLKNFVKRIATSTRNVMLNKPPVVDVVSQIEPLLEKIDKQQSLESFIQQVALYQILDGYTYIVIDAPKIDETVVSKSDEQRLGIEPYMYIVRRNSVVNWKLKDNGDFERLTIKEIYESNTGRYDSDYKEQYRTYFDDGTVEIWRDKSLFETIQLGVKMVPVVRVGRFDIPALYDIAKLNINHLNRRSNLDRYLTIAALPVPVIYGSMADESKVVIGVDQALIFNDKNEGGFEWSELSGTSIKALQEDLLMTEASILEEAISLTSNDVAKNETQVNSENLEGFGRMTHTAVQLEDGMNKALSILGEFKSLTDVGTIEINKDFSSSKLSSEEVKDLIALHANGMISLDTALAKLAEGQVIDIEDINQEKAKIGNVQ